MASRALPAVMAVVLAATVATGLATAATKGAGGARACVNSAGDLRLLNGTGCPRGDRLVALARRGPKGPPGRAARPEQDVVSQSAKQIDLASGKATVTTIARLRALPSGSWEFSTAATLVNFGRADYIRCKIMVGGKQVASGAATVGTPPASGVTGVPPAAATVANLALIGTAAPAKKFTAALDCWHDLKSKGPVPYLDPGAVLLARRVGAIATR